MALPLAGIRVLDATAVYAGPTCGRVLSDLGAEVIRVEGMQRFDRVRFLIPFTEVETDRFWELGSYFHMRNLGKKDITLDLSREEGRELFRLLVPQVDIVLESFAPRVFRQFGLAYEDLKQLRPDVIMVSLSGYGQSGSMSDFTAYGMGLEPASGISSVTGYPGGPPQRTGISLTDPLSGLVGAGAALTALLHRDKTGEGQYIDLSEHEAAIPMMGPALLDQQANGRTWERIGNRSRTFAPQGCYRCVGEDNWLVLTCRSDTEFAALCELIGRPELASDSRLATLAGRRAHHDEIDGAISAWTTHQDKMEAMHELQDRGIPAGAVLHARELYDSPQLAARDHWDRLTHPIAGLRPFPRQLVAKSRRWVARPQGPSPQLGEHNDEVLSSLGVAAERLAELREAKVIGEELDPPIPKEMAQIVMTMPVDLLMAKGALLEVDSNYRQHLGLDEGSAEEQ